MSDQQTEREPSLDELVTLFRDYKDDETGGQHAQRGFTFQVWQAVLEALKAHAAGEDYAVVLEWQQDIALLNSSSAPTEVRFIQLKKNESTLHWTLHGLLTPDGDDEEADRKALVITEAAQTEEKDKPPHQKKKRKTPKHSILAKLYFHRLRFKPLLQADLVFASNARFYLDIDEEGGQKVVDSSELSQLPPSSLEKVKNRLRKQLNVPDLDEIDLARFRLERTECPLDNAHKHMVGELVELCQLGKVQPTVTAPFIAIHLLASYIRERAGKGSYAKNFDALLKRAVTRSDVDKYFAAANDSQVKTEDLIDEVRARLNSETADYSLVRDMRRETNRACIEISNRTSPVWGVVHSLLHLFTVNASYAHLPLVKDKFAQWLKDFKETSAEKCSLYNGGYLYCLMAMIIEDANPIKHLSTVSPSAQLEAEE